MAKAPAGMKRQTKDEWMRIELPYGLWVCEDGREVLFNRWYHPIYQRTPDGKVSPTDPAEWVKYKHQSWFYQDINTPWRNKASLSTCLQKLQEWGATAPDLKAPRYKPKDYRGSYRETHRMPEIVGNGAAHEKPAPVTDPLEMARQIAAGLDVPAATLETILRRVGNVCRRKQMRSERETIEDSDVSWRSGYAGGCGDCADLVGHIADLVGDGRL